MRTTFIITSAINPGVGLFNPEQRINQTIQTVSSIKNAFPQSNLILIDGGKSFQEDLDNFLILKSKINLYLNMHENIQIKNLHNNFFSKIKNKYELGGNAGGKVTVQQEKFYIIKTGMADIALNDQKTQLNRIMPAVKKANKGKKGSSPK